VRVSSMITVAALASVAACVSQRSSQELSDMSGKEMYGRLCTSCHGVSGTGNGPMAPLLKIEVPDLTRLAQRHSGEFPAEHVRRTIDGRFDRPAHGLPYMPVWGSRFYDSEAPNDAGERARADSLIDRLVAYLRSIQEH
jgi:mono/diheme cytochrome c family protein